MSNELYCKNYVNITFSYDYSADYDTGYVEEA
jgi:hypothetical protein